MTNLNLIYVHIGNQLPECFLDNIYQTLLVNTNHINIYIVLNDELIKDVQTQINSLNDVYFKKSQFNIIFIRNSLIENHLSNDNAYKTYIQTIKRFNVDNFREEFWISTTKRFYYLLAVMQIFYLNDSFHIENDVILYENLNAIYKSIENIGKLNFVKDAPQRVIPSIIFMPNVNELEKLIIFITDKLQNSNVFLNDMVLLAEYPDYNSFNIFPDNQKCYLFDGACIGQYIDGVDVKNIPNQPKNTNIYKFENPTRGFINETCMYKPNTTLFYKKLHVVNDINIPLNIMLGDTNVNNSTITNIIPNVHVHSKQLYKFSSVFDLQMSDIISGDKIVGLCDFALSTSQINNFHKNIEKFININNIILIKDFNNINYNSLNTIFKNSGKKQLKLFIYTHLLEILVKIDFFKHVNTKIEYILYIHNSDHTFDETYQSLLQYDHIKMIYTQNLNIDSPKVKLLPIGLANSMWPHGNMLEFYDVMRNTYLLQKKNNIYININANTYSYRQTILDKLKECNWSLSSGKPYKDYLYELSSYYFCLCVRGNGIDTHRFWESLYLGVIPVIINDQTTNCQAFVNALNELEIPFYEIKDLNFFKNKTNDIFNKELYIKMITKLNNSIQNLKTLKLSFYN